MGSHAPQTGKSTINTQWNMSLMWKLFTLLVVFQACSIHNVHAKQLKTDLIFDDTFDIDQAEEAPTAVISDQKLPGSSDLDLDEQDLLEDELQPVDETENESGWLMKNVKRVRRELGRFFGKAEEETKPKKHKKRDRNEQRPKKEQRQNQLARKKRVHHDKPEKQTKKLNTAAKAAGKHNKRSPYGDDEYEEGSGHITDDGDDEGDAIEYYRTLFTVREPWTDAYSEGTGSQEFMELHRQLETAFRDFYQSLYYSDDSDLSIRATLLSVFRTRDHYKIDVIMQLEIPAKITNFGDHFRQQIENYQSFGSIGAEIDENYYFRRITDINEPLDYSPTGPIYTPQPHEDEEEEDINDHRYDENGNAPDNEGDGERNGEGDGDDNGEDNNGYGEGERESDRNGDDTGRTGTGDDYENLYNCDVNPNGYFVCQSGQTVECVRRCDNYIDCDDESDEEENMCREVLNAEDSTTESVIDDRGSVHERDPEREPDHDIEEQPRPESRDYEFESLRECDLNPESNFYCDSRAMPCYLRCDGYPHCTSGIDESPQFCGSDSNEPVDIPEISTNEPETRIDESDQHAGGDRDHDGDRDGFEGSGDDFGFTTETNPLFSRPEPDYSDVGCRGDTSFRCPISGRQICDEQRCDGVEHCPDGEDEENCPGESDGAWPEYEKVCSENEFKCDDRCLPKEYQCNGVFECIDHTDEDNCPSPEERECQPNEFRCRSGDCIDSRRRCDRVRDCPDGDDEGESCRCASNQFRCRNGDCISAAGQCNGYSDCRDGSDEENCATNYYPGRQCSPAEFRCDNGKCINAAARCNGYTDCDDSSDEKYCTPTPNKACGPNMFRCENGPCIQATLRCNGIVDCPFDISDELDCAPINNEIDTGLDPTPAPQLNLKTYPNSQIIKESREVVFRCRDEGPLRAKVRWSRPGGGPLPSGFTDVNGRLEIPNIRIEDSGAYVCEAVDYQRHIPGQSVSVHLTVERYNPLLDRTPTACAANKATCNNGECIDKSQICDGIPHCSDGSDERSCSHGRKCQPNQFMCRNSRCVDRIWRCDGENDCGDNSDEDSCDPEPSGAPCRYDEFQCASGHCIPKSFQCDSTPDCKDSSDEIGCMAPAFIRPPPSAVHLNAGESLNLTCVGTGTPVPVIVWRLNWGHVPEKCTSKTHAGTGNLYCPNMEVRDSGAYSCEILNSKGSVFPPDAIVTVDEPSRPDVCPAGFFNMLARRRDECISCFCFGISKNCRSANLYNFAIQPPIVSHRVVNVDLSPYSDISISDAPSGGLSQLHHGVQFRMSDVKFGQRESPYLALPNDYEGNQLKSYGGYLRYDVNFVGSGRPSQVPDVILTGNGYTLVHQARPQAQEGITNKMAVQFTPGNWKRPDGRTVTREEIMMVLANVDNILIRLSYIDATEREVELTNIVMDSAGLQDQGLGSASLVEQCSCPVGYIGDSCETCAPGFVRQPGGPWLGRCVPYEPEPCGPGTYGDPRRGIPCRECPCPQTGPNNFASGCRLGPDGEVTCNCHEGYSGRRCEYCAPGYQGNPLVPGGRCFPTPTSHCNADGTYSQNDNGTCQCKPLVVGPYCDTCAPESFHLNSFTYTGCIECFCSGLTKQCTSSSWYRDQISSSFGHSRAPHGFNLIRDYETAHPVQVAFQLLENTLQFSNQPYPDPLYWSLPPQFLGDKITAYGGKLNYTLSYNPLPGGLMSKNNAPDVVIKSGEDLTIIHYRKSGVNPSQSTSYSVPIIESAWQRSDGQPVNREHLLMALSKIDAIYIKATYTTSTRDGALTQVSLDIATQTNLGTPRAVEVEECRCPVGYVGLSCERCAPGYKRDTEAGLYLGVCEPCECNGHSEQCDAETGVCLNCADNTEGEFCDRCIEGYTGNPSGGTPYDCTPEGRPYPPPYPTPRPGNQTACDYCNSAGTISCDGGYCNCKANVVGSRCDQCRSGTFDLSSRNSQGCSECYCSGKRTQCHSANLYRHLIPVDFFGDKPLLTDDEGNIVDTGNLHHDESSNMYIYSYTSYTPKYWSVRGSVLGNQLYSYGGDLSYNLEVETYGDYMPGNDVLLIGNGKKLVWSRPESEQDNTEYRVRLHEDEVWHRVDGGQAVRASRTDFMSVLSNLEHLLIRATPKIPSTRTAIGDIILESAVENSYPGAQSAPEIEVCSCPEGYTGSSCETCAPMYYNDNYGNCVACPCQEDTTSACSLGKSGYVECQCRAGYSGDRCQYPLDYPQPTTPTPQPEYDYKTQITVSIAPPEITIIPVGGSLTLTCTGRLTWNGIPVLVHWYKLEGRLPYSSDESDGTLRLYDLQISDSGIYICRAINNETKRVFEDQVSITITESSQRQPAQIINLPTYVTFQEDQVNEIVCEVIGNPTPSVIWTRIDGQMSRDVRTDGTRLIFEAPRKSDEGSYRCHANNGVGTDEKYTQVYVSASVPVPREFVYIDPPSYTGEPGIIVRLNCQSTMPIHLSYVWTKDGYDLYSQRNVIIEGSQLEITQPTSRDSGVYTCIGIDMRSRRNYTSEARVIIEESRPYPPPPPGPLPGTARPTVKALPPENRIVQGQDFSITCEANGTPYPNIKWTKLHESLADNVQQTGNVLRIINARSENRGMYVCIAENSAGSDQANTIIDVEPRERPTVYIHPPEPQEYYIGSEGMLYCRANGIPEPSVQWRRVDGQPLSPRHKEVAPGHINIMDMQLSDAGNYECTAENEVGRASSVATITIIEPPTISIEPNEERLRLTEGDELKVVCAATGVPSPTVQWVDVAAERPYAFAPATTTFNQAVLEIFRVTSRDSKTYKCIATNSAGTEERYITVDVIPRRGDTPIDSDVDHNPYQPQPRPPYSVTPPQNIYRANAGDDVKLSCEPEESTPYQRASWARVDGRPLPLNSHLESNSLIIRGVNDENSGEYRCDVYDNRGSIVTIVVAELVLIPIPHITFHPKIPVVVAPNENIDIYCEVSGEQPIQVSWHTDNNRPLSNSVRIEGQYLHFVSITPADAGRYYCTASNRYGNTTNMAEVVVNRGNVYEQIPPARRYDINEGEDVTLQCEVQPIREPIRGEIKYEWRREDGRRLPSNSYIHNQVLYLRAVRKEDEGRYVCESYSTGGSKSAPSFVDLYIKPGLAPYRPPYEPPRTTPLPRAPVLKLDQQHSTLRVGESTEVECYPSDNSYTDVSWERSDGRPLPPHIQQVGNRLIISHVTAADAGNYVCKCKIDGGDLYTTSYELEIEESLHEWKRPKIEYAQVGAAVQLNCDADESSSNYRWSRQYGQMQPGRDLFNSQLTLQDVQANDAGTYICTTTTRDGESVDYPTILVITGAIPRFHQNPVSYMSFPTLADSHIQFNFDITFRPESEDGLLLYNGQKRGSGDYISLSLKDGLPEFRFDFNQKPMVIRAERPISLNEWHTIRVHRFRRDGYMQVDDQHPVAFPSMMQISPLDLIEDLYVGGVPNWDMLPEEAVEEKTGFVGCISRVTLQGSIIELMKEAKFKEGITACEPCESRPCANGGICLESQTEMAYTCICQQGWTGRNCAIEGTQCTPGICGAGRCENTEEGMECLCPLNKTGDRCQYIEHLNERSLAFKRNSYAAYGTPRASKLNIKFQVRPNSLADAVLIYAAESKLPSGDFFAVLLHNQHVELIINTGARLRPVLVRSLQPLPLHKWTEIEVSRRFGEGILRVGDEPEQRAKASGLARTLYIKTPLYVGGYDHENVKLNRDVNITNGFDGCISSLQESQRHINLLTDIIDAANIQNCGELNEIDETNESMNNVVQPDNQQVPPAVSSDPCASDPCENGGSCSVQHNNMAVCSCPLGFAGKHCEDHITIELDANFHGNGYLELNRNQFDEEIEQKYSFAAMVFSTNDPNGLLLWWGQPKDEEYTGQDFMALALVDGIVEFSFRLNGEETVIRNPDKRVDDGRRHIVLIKRTDNTAMLELDHLLDAGETRPTGKDTMSLPGHVFIGGAPDIVKFTGGRYMKNFNGCVRVVEGDSAGIIQLGSGAVSGVNVDTCPIADESLEGTEPPVV